MKKSATERAIDQLDSEIAVLVAAKTRLQQQAQKPKPRKEKPLVTDGSLPLRRQREIVTGEP